MVMVYSYYQVFSEGDAKSLVVDEFTNFDEALATYEQKHGFLLLGIEAPNAFDVIYARPYGMCLIS